MKRRMNKSGQFYLVAALVIIALIASFAGITNYIKKTGPVKIYDLKEELGIESGQVLDYGIYNEFDNDKTNELLKDFTENYSGYVEKGFSLYFVFGNADDLVIAGYKDLISGTVSYDLGDQRPALSITKGVYNSTTLDVPVNRIVEVVIDDKEYTFNLNEKGQTFYFVIYQKTEGGNVYVEQG